MVILKVLDIEILIFEIKNGCKYFKLGWKNLTEKRGWKVFSKKNSDEVFIDKMNLTSGPIIEIYLQEMTDTI